MVGVQYMICHWAINRTDPQNLLSTTLDVLLHYPNILFQSCLHSSTLWLCDQTILIVVLLTM